MTDVDVADVHKRGVPAAHLRYAGGEVTFSYRRDYLDSERPAVATTLPLSEEPVVTRGRGVPAYFAGLLPEGRRLSGLRRALKTSADDELSLLVAVGKDPVGDVQVVAAGGDPAPPEPLVRVERSFDDVDFAELVDAAAIDPVALAGVQDKASARMISLPVARAGARFILKLDPPEYPHVVENEAYFLELARRARMPAATAHVVHDRRGRPGLLVERFDRVVAPDGSTAALAMEDAAQVMNLPPADKYRVAAIDALRALADLCPARAVASRAIYRQLCVAWLTGNGDVHAKNLSVLADLNGEWRISPAYDVPSTVPYGDATMALPIDGRRDGFSRRRLLTFGHEAGLPPRAAESALDEALAATEQVPDDIARGTFGFAPDVRKKWAAVLRRRRRDAEG